VDSSQAEPLNASLASSLLDEISRLSPKAEEGHFDELRGNAEGLLAHWKTFFEQLEPVAYRLKPKKVILTSCAAMQRDYLLIGKPFLSN